MVTFRDTVSWNFTGAPRAVIISRNLIGLMHSGAITPLSASPFMHIFAPTITGAATKLGFAVGILTTKAIEALCRGVGRRSRLILDNIGIVFKAQEAYDWYRKQTGVEKLDERERSEAWQKYAIKLITEKAKVLEE